MENIETQKNNLKNAILEKIKSGEVKMRPKAYFIVKVGSLMLVAFLTFVVSVLLISYTLFSLHVGGQIFLLGFGARGFYEFLIVFPWILVLIDLALLLFFDYLMKKFKFGYGSPIVYLFLGSIGLIIIFGVLLNLTSFHRGLLDRAEHKHLPFMGGFYNDLKQSHKEYGIFQGQIVSLATSSFSFQYIDNDPETDDPIVNVYIPAGFNIESILSSGDEVFVAGDMIGTGTIKSYGVRKIENR